MNSKHILTECYINTLLAEVVSSLSGCNHQHNRPKVLKTMKEKFSDSVALCVIDNDMLPKEKENYSLLEPTEHLSIYKHKEKPHYIVTVGKKGKAAEDFILKNAQRCNITLAEYDLPTDLAGLRKLKRPSVQEIKKFQKLFSTLKQHQHSDFHTLAKWIEQFKKDPYSLNAHSL